MNLRIPIDTNIEFVKNIFIAKCSEFKGLQVNFNGEKQPLFVHQDSKLITILTQIFNKHTQTNAKPITIGGATYARAFKNFASYGPNMPGEKDLCHQSDEYISIDNLIISAKIYANAIYELDKLNKKG